MWSEPAGALTDLAMAQWEEASVITVRANVVAAGMIPFCTQHLLKMTRPLPCQYGGLKGALSNLSVEITLCNTVHPPITFCGVQLLQASCM